MVRIPGVFCWKLRENCGFQWNPDFLEIYGFSMKQRCFPIQIWQFCVFQWAYAWIHRKSAEIWKFQLNPQFSLSFLSIQAWKSTDFNKIFGISSAKNTSDLGLASRFPITARIMASSKATGHTDTGTYQPDTAVSLGDYRHSRFFLAYARTFRFRNVAGEHPSIQNSFVRKSCHLVIIHKANLTWYFNTCW